MLKRKDLAEEVIDRVDYPNRGYFEDPETKQCGQVKNTMPGQKVLFRVFKRKGGMVYGRLISVTERSPLETRAPYCAISDDCGGCIYQRVPYETQLKIKEDQLKRLMEPVTDPESSFDGIIPAPKEKCYRNKFDFSFGDEVPGGPLTLGMHRRGTRYTVLNADTCSLAHPDLRKILACVREFCAGTGLPFFNKLTHVGFYRFLMLRRSETTGEILVCLAVTTQYSVDFSDLARRILDLDLEGKIAGIFTADDDKLADALIPDAIHCLYGRDSFTESLLGLKFRVSLFSFFQTNTRGAEELYKVVRNYVSETLPIRKPVIYDLYSGTGTIGQMMAPAASNVYGIEIVPEAVKAAAENAALNGLANCTFIAGDVLEKLPEIPEKPDYIILDPPREGLHPKALKEIASYNVPNMVYISCKATSFVRDMKVLREYGYGIKNWCLVDMFPETQHVETVCCLKKRKPDAYISLTISV